MPETISLYDHIRSILTTRIRLPVQPTKLVGREDELARIDRCFSLPDCRLLTLVGPGGIGKTRLAIQVAQNQRVSFLDGVYFVSLVEVPSPDLIIFKIADSLNFHFYRQQGQKQQLLDYLREKELLLILDNFDFLIEGAGLLTDILLVAPHIKILVTSRQRLNLRWEWLFTVPGLAFPTNNEDGSLESYGAVKCLAQCARRIDPAFSLAQVGPTVAHICRLVEGMPLALELAAAAAADLSWSEIAAELEQTLDVLEHSFRDAPDRHLSVRAAFEGSWRLLSPEEQEALRSLTVFRGSFDRHAAKQVCDCSYSLLDSLVDRSLLNRIDANRYALHHLLWQFTTNLKDFKAHDGLKRKHCHYFMTLLTGLARDLLGDRQYESLEIISRELENVQEAFKFTVHSPDPHIPGPAAEALYLIYDIRGWFEKGRDIFREAVMAVQSKTQANGILENLIAFHGWFNYRLGFYDQAHDLANQSLAQCRENGAHRTRAFSLSILGAIAEEKGDYDQAKDLYEKSIAHYELADDRLGIARICEHLGDLARMTGAYPVAQHYYGRCLEIYQDAGAQNGLASAYNSLGSAAGTQGNYYQARAYFEKSLVICEKLNNPFGIARASHNLGTVEFVQGNLSGAEKLRQKTLTICKNIGFRWGIADALRHLGDVYCEMGR
ncbi:MAG: tetratricopeptide repeat protein [Anaerolineales bacterium]|nr:tetratricopeptide repeat protein [Anaerolineales bacterium]